MDLSQLEFGRWAGISKAAMNNIEKGRNFPAIPNVVALCEAHDLSLEWVLAGSFRRLRHDLVAAKAGHTPRHRPSAKATTIRIDTS